MVQETSAPAAEIAVKQAPAARGRRVAMGVLKGVIAVGGVVGAVLALSWLNVMPGGWRVRSHWASTRDGRQLQAFEREAATLPPGTVVFLGSSGIAKFPLAHTFPGKPWVNRGIGGEDTPGMLARLDKSLPVARPAGVVINGGVNDFRAGRQEPPVVVARVAAVVDAVQARFPGVPIALMEPIPQTVEPPDLVVQLTLVSEALETYAQQHHLAYVCTNRPPLTDEDGRLRTDMAAGDGRHLNEKGYEVLSKWLLAEGGAAVDPLR
jgi:lysophospholipase L1-like esterase